MIKINEVRVEIRPSPRYAMVLMVGFIGVREGREYFNAVRTDEIGVRWSCALDRWLAEERLKANSLFKGKTFRSNDTLLAKAHAYVSRAQARFDRSNKNATAKGGDIVKKKTTKKGKKSTKKGCK